MIETFFADLDSWTETRVFPLRRGGLGVYFRDITDRRSMEQDRERLPQRLPEDEQRGDAGEPHHRGRAPPPAGAAHVVVDRAGHPQRDGGGRRHHGGEDEPFRQSVHD